MRLDLDAGRGADPDRVRERRCHRLLRRLLGPSAGSFCVLAFVRLLGFDFLNARAGAKLLNVATNFAALVLPALKGYVWWHVAVVGPCSEPFPDGRVPTGDVSRARAKQQGPGVSVRRIGQRAAGR